MSTPTIVFIVLLVLIIAAGVALYFLGQKAQKKQAETDAQMDAIKQTVSMLIIDKKRMKLKDSGLPAVVIQGTPWYLRGSKVPVVKAKIGPQIMSLISDERVFDQIPVKKEVKAVVAGIYIKDVKGIHGNSAKAAPEKKSKFKQFTEMLQEKAGAKPLDAKKK